MGVPKIFGLITSIMIDWGLFRVPCLWKLPHWRRTGIMPESPTRRLELHRLEGALGVAKCTESAADKDLQQPVSQRIEVTQKRSSAMLVPVLGRAQVRAESRLERAT